MAHCTLAPTGHWRIKQAHDALPGRSIGFARDQVADRDSRFLDHAYEQGAGIEGAADASGEAPKLLLAEDAQGELYLGTNLGRQPACVRTGS